MKDSIWHPYTRFSAMEEGPLPLIVRGQGPYLYDEAGTRYFDAISSWWACSLGHGHPRIVRAIQAQAETLQHSILGNLSHPSALRLAHDLVRLTGGGRHVHFASDGAGAVEAALKIAIQYWTNRGATGRHLFAALTEPYHGDTLGAVAVGYMESFHKPFRPLLFPTVRLPFPDCSSCSRAPVTGLCPRPCLAATEERLWAHANELAAVVVEPLCQGAAGLRMYGPGYLAGLADLCRELDILLIVDEVATGFCKTGRMFAYEHAGVEPDIICLGKGLSAGYLPISAAVVKDAIYETFGDQPEDNTFYHGHTFAGNPIASAAAVEAIRVYEEENMPARAEAIGTVVEAALQPLVTLPGVKEVRHLGAFCAVELTENGGVARARTIRDELLRNGVLIRPLGPVVYLVPPLVTTNEELEETCAKVRAAVEAAG